VNPVVAILQILVLTTSFINLSWAEHSRSLSLLHLLHDDIPALGDLVMTNFEVDWLTVSVQLAIFYKDIVASNPSLPVDNCPHVSFTLWCILGTFFRHFVIDALSLHLKTILHMSHVAI
jgi:hypothetical protein